MREDIGELTDGELEPLLEVWNDQKLSLSQAGTLEKFNHELRREWSIETGIIEGIYDLDLGTTEALIQNGIDSSLIPRDHNTKSPEHIAAILQDHSDALEHVFDFVKGARDLTAGYVKELHSILLRNQDTYTVVDQFGKQFEKPLEKGVYKTLPNNPRRQDGNVHEYCPPEQVSSEIDRMIRWHEEHLGRAVATEVTAAWLHHAFSQIHPFPDGNGRVARALASLAFIKSGWFPLVVRRDHRTRYISCLEQADSGQLRPLTDYFVEVERNSLVRAGEVAADVAPPGKIEDAIASARNWLVTTGQMAPPLWKGQTVCRPTHEPSR